MTLTPMQDALYRIQGHLGRAQDDLRIVRDELGKRRAGGPDAVADLDTALTTMSEALGDALAAYTNLRGNPR
jgi:hypothetical protein